MGVDGLAAARTLLARGTCEPGLCLYYVWQAYKAHGASTGRSAGTAYLAWQRSDGQHPGDRNPPPGVPVYWGPKASSSAGDVTISLGGGRIAATDWPYSGVIGETTIDARERQIGRPYLGWTEAIFDYPIDFSAAAGGGSTPFEEDEMNESQELLLKAVAENAGEVRRMAAVILGARDGATDAERKLWSRLNGIDENAAEARRMGGVILGVLPPAGEESRPVGGVSGVLDDAALTAIARAAAEGAKVGGESGAKAAIAALTLVAQPA